MAVDLLNIRGLKEIEQQAPVVMVNLMRFRDRSLDGDGSGWDAYLRYSALTVPMIKARGGTLLWTGNAKAVALGAQDGNKWDYVALVYYPSVAAFVDMIFALTSFAMFAMLRRDRSVDDVCALVKTACRSALDPLLPDRRRSSRS